MSEMEEKLNQVLSNPQMMQQIMALAQSLGGSPPQPQAEKKQEPEPGGFSLDPRVLKQIAGMASRSGVDQNQQALLRALGPYISRDRAYKLEKAMRAARMATAASSLLQSGALQSLVGR